MSLLCSILHSAIISSFINPNVVHNTFFISDGLDLCSFVGVRGEVSYSYKMMDTIMALYV